MDTKSRSVKPALAFLAFVLGVTLLVYSAAAAVIVTVASGGSFYIPWRDIFWTDYQTTDSFHSFIKDRLYELATAADTPEEENPLEGWDDGLLYRVRADGVLKFSNTDALSPDRLPDGYNFLITYDGEKVTAVKDGRDIPPPLRGSGRCVRLSGRGRAPARIRLVVSRLPGRFSPTEPCLLFLLPVSSAPGGYRPHRPVHCVAPSQGAGRPGHRLVHRAGVAGGQAPAARPLPLGVRPGRNVLSGRADGGGAHLQHCALPLRPPGPVVGLPLYQRPAVQFRTPQGAEPVRRLCAPAPAADPAPPRRPAGRPTDDLAVCRLPPLFPVLRPVRAGLSGVPSAPSAAAPALYGRDRADRSPGVAGQGKPPLCR